MYLFMSLLHSCLLFNNGICREVMSHILYFLRVHKDFVKQELFLFYNPIFVLNFIFVPT